jgi:hypothetical protein
METQIEEHFVLDDVSRAGENILIEQHVANHGVYLFGDEAHNAPLVPLVRHHVDAPIVD